MTKKSNITKCTSYLLLVIMLYMHFCSALCATSASGCCAKEENDNDHCKKSCCADEKESGEKKDDCQNLHFSFFNTTGQFPSEQNVDVIKVFPTLIALVTPIVNVLSVSQTKNNFAFNCFHPPPPKTDIRIFIQSFLI